MNGETELDILIEIVGQMSDRAAAPAIHRVPVDRYICDERALRERDHVFRRSWLRNA